MKCTILTFLKKNLVRELKMAIERNIEHEVKITIPLQDIVLDGNLYVPENAKGIVAFVHGSGSSRFSPRNRFVAKYINKGGFATLLFDLLTRSEEARDLITADLRFDIDLLSERLSGTTEWLFNNPDTREFQIGYFGASTGAAAALVSSVGRKNVKAVVSRGGRPDMAGEALAKISAPTLLIVGGEDDIVIELNNRAYDILGAQAKRMDIVPGATHLFEEPGALEKVAELALNWFSKYLS